MNAWWPTLFVFMAACTTEQKAINYLNTHADVAENYCMTAYPIKVEVDTVVISTRDWSTDSAYNSLLDYVDSLLSLPDVVIHDGIRKISRERFVVLKPDTVTHTVVRTYENRALVNQLRGQIADMTAELNDYSVKVDNRNKILASLGSLLIGLVGFYFKRKANA
mgnify:CR=1 FL=1